MVCVLISGMVVCALMVCPDQRNGGVCPDGVS